MARIRTIKPDFFRHEKLFEAERETGLSLRLAFAGLWTVADREGRFRWLPRTLKLDCLPYDDVDFSRVLDALATRGFIVRYSIDGVEYGAIPSWGSHQIINNREKQSDIPPPNNINALTREPRVDDASQSSLCNYTGEGKGREEEGKGKEDTADAVSPENSYAFESGVIRLSKKDLDKWKSSFRNLDVEAELLGLTEWAGQQQEKWFFAISGALAKRNRDIGVRRSASQRGTPVTRAGVPYPEGII